MEDLRKTAGIKTRTYTKKDGDKTEKTETLQLFSTLEDIIHDLAVCRVAISRLETDLRKAHCEMEHHEAKKKEIEELIARRRDRRAQPETEDHSPAEE